LKHSPEDHLVLDSKDRVLLSLIQKNAEYSLSELGRTVGLSKMAVHNRLNALKENGIIEGSFYKVNAEKVGQDYCVISRITCVYKGQEQLKIAKAIGRLPGVQSIYFIFGSSDILIIARRSNKTSARDLLYKVLKVPGVSSTVTTVAHTTIKESLTVDTLTDY
jgi:Lrp/AsnC family transcriptional regulator, leucine-responsive regulatory protein